MLSRFIPAVVAASLTASLSGCLPASQRSSSLPSNHARSQRITPASALAPLTDARTLAAASVQSLPLYHKAQWACIAHRYHDAAVLLGRLAASASLTANQRAFVRQQRALCLRDAGERVFITEGTQEHRGGEIEEARATLRAVPAPLRSPSIGGVEEADCGPRALGLVCKHLGVAASLLQTRQWAGTTERGTSLAGLTTAAKRLGLKAEGVQVSRDALPEQPMPALAYVNGNHFLAVLALSGEGESGTAVIHDPNAPHEETISQERLLRLCSGYLLLLARR